MDPAEQGRAFAAEHLEAVRTAAEGWEFRTFRCGMTFPEDREPAEAEVFRRACVRALGEALEAEWAAVAGDLRRTLAGLDEADLERPPAVELHPGFEDELATRRAFLEGHLFHLTWHAGQVGMLRAALGLGWA